MKQVLTSSLLEVRNNQMAQLLCDPKQRTLLEVFLEPNTMAVAACRVGLTIHQVYAALQKFLAAGIVVIFDTQPRKGRAIKRYILVAHEFFVPFALVGFEEMLLEQHLHFSRELFAALLKQWFSITDSSSGWGLLISQTKQKTLLTRAPVHLPHHLQGKNLPSPPVLARWWHWHLSAQDRDSLYLELLELQKKYQNKSRSEPANVLVHLAISPLEQ